MTGFMKALQTYDKEMGTVNSFPKPEPVAKVENEEIIEDIEKPEPVEEVKKEVKVTSEPIINTDEKEGVNNG